MTWNSRNSKIRTTIGCQRRAFKLSVAWAWIERNHPDIAVLINEQAAEKFPLLNNNGRAHSKEVLVALSNLAVQRMPHKKAVSA